MTTDRFFDFAVDTAKATLTVTRDFAAPRRLVWDCHTQAALLDRWFAPKPLTTRTASMDFREGGHWHFAMVMPDGQEFWSRQDYVEIHPISSYVSLDAFSDESGAVSPDLPQARWTATFTEEGRDTRVQTVVVYPSPEDLEKVMAMGMKEGLTSTLERLDELLEALGGTAEPGKVTITALVAAPAETVWAAWTEPVHITQWNFATPDWRCPSARSDLRVGGTYTARMEAKDGSFGFDFDGTFHQVDPGRAIGLTLGDGRRADTTFAPEKGGIRVTTIFDAEGTHPVEMQRGGWQAILDNFKAHAETL